MASPKNDNWLEEPVTMEVEGLTDPEKLHIAELAAEIRSLAIDLKSTTGTSSILQSLLSVLIPPNAYQLNPNFNAHTLETQRQRAILRITHVQRILAKLKDRLHQLAPHVRYHTTQEVVDPNAVPEEVDDEEEEDDF